MPTYEYRCENGHDFERVQKMSEKPLTKCPECGAKASRVISGGQGLIFKGSGFYITDYGKDGKGARKDPTAPTTSESGDAKSDSAAKSKPESGGEPKAKRDGASSSPAEPKGDTKPANNPKPGKSDAS
jgi:putative FmdB family regulatory protein